MGKTKSSGAIAERPKRTPTLKDWLGQDAFKDAVSKSLPKHLPADRFVRVALTALNRTPRLQQCTQESVFNCLLDLSGLGLEPDGRRAYLIPYGTDCTLVVGYQGLVELVRRSGEVSYIHADVVYKRDTFSFAYGSRAHLDHVPALDDDRGDALAVYSFVKMRDGAEDFSVFTIAQINKVRDASRAKGSGPWKSHWDEMAKKTAFRNHSKWLPFSAEVRRAIEIDDHALGPVETDPGTIDLGDLTPGKRTPVGKDEPSAEDPTEERPADEQAEDEAERKRQLEELQEAIGDQAPEADPEEPADGDGELSTEDMAEIIGMWPPSKFERVCAAVGIEASHPDDLNEMDVLPVYEAGMQSDDESEGGDET